MGRNFIDFDIIKAFGNCNFIVQVDCKFNAEQAEAVSNYSCWRLKELKGVEVYCCMREYYYQQLE